MKRIKSVVLALSLVFVAFGTKANTTPDEGMWLPMLINKNYDEMKKSVLNYQPMIFIM